MKKFDWFLCYPEVIMFDNDDVSDDVIDDGDVNDDVSDDDVNDDDDDDSGHKAKSQPAQQKPKKRFFSQEDVDKIVTKRNKAVRGQLQKMEQNYQKLLEQQNLNDEQRAQLETDLENIQAQLRTKEQQLEYEKKKASEKHQMEIKQTAEQRDYYKSLYETSTIERAITDAAVKHDGYNPSQFVAFLREKSKMVEEIDTTGNKTGRLVPRIEWEVADEATGQRERVLKAPDEVVELMKDNVTEFGNMFRQNISRGVGETNMPAQDGKGRVNHKKMTTEEYMRLRKDKDARKAMGLDR